MIKKMIGRVGIDTIKLSGWLNPPYPHQVKPVLLALEGNDRYKVNISNTKASITFGRTTVVFGVNNTKKTPYINMAIKAAYGGPNLEGMSVQDVWNEILKTANLLPQVCGIALQWDHSLKVTQIEINKTFPLNEKFGEYSRILSLIAMIEVKNENTKYEASRKVLDNCFEAESLLCKRSTVALGIYDKSAEMKQKREGSSKDPLMRVEYRLLKSSAILANFKTEFFAELTDASITACFNNRTQKIIAAIDKYLDRKKQLPRDGIWERETVASMMLQLSEQGQLSISNLIAKISMYEARYRASCVLDIEDCWDIYRMLMEQGYYPAGSDEAFMNELMANYRGVDTHYNFMVNQRAYYRELQGKMLGNELYEVSLDY